MVTEPSKTENGQDEAPQTNPIEDLEAKLKEEKNKYLYLYSDFENFRRRNERERIDFFKFGHERFLKDLVLILDNFERAIKQAKDLNEKSAVTQGIEMIHYQFLEALKNQGVSEIKAVGEKFDPGLHEAIGEEESDQESGIITKEHLKGYRLHDRLLRAAKVVVTKKKAGT
jgi:molecular chaperone GrpE